MESRKFIKDAAALIEKITLLQNVISTPDELRQQRDATQKEINQLFGGLQNPTLPSAYRLRDAAQRAGYFVNPGMLTRLRDHEYLSS